MIAPSQRLPGPDVVRALAMLGVIIMNFHGYLINAGGRRDGGALYDFFDPWEGPLSTRFAATFVLTAGVGVTLMTRSAVGAEVADRSWVLVRRGLLLYGAGLLFNWIWAGTILPYYGALFVLGAVLWRLPSWVLWVVGAGAAVAAWLLSWWSYEQRLSGHNLDWLYSPGARSPRGLLLNLFINGTHPLLPWLCYFCVGIILGRSLGNPQRCRQFGIGGAALWLIANAIAMLRSGELGGLLLSPHPLDRGIVYTASALGSALVAFVLINEIANRFRSTAPVELLASAGQLSLSIYVAHTLIFNYLVNVSGVIKPGGLTTSLTLAVIYWVVALTVATAYQRRFGRGPLEALYRRLTA